MEAFFVYEDGLDCLPVSSFLPERWKLKEGVIAPSMEGPVIAKLWQGWGLENPSSRDYAAIGSAKTTKPASQGDLLLSMASAVLNLQAGEIAVRSGGCPAEGMNTQPPKPPGIRKDDAKATH